MIERSMTALALVGATWVLWLLLFLSVVSVAIMIERALFYLARRVDSRALTTQLASLLDKRDLEGARALVRDQDSMEGLVVAEGLGSLGKGSAAVRELMAGELARQRARFERRLIFLGTLGNNAPFIGLFGTVLGIIKAFRDLALTDPARGAAAPGAQAVMAGISEALVATAVGLAVALPAVVAFNYFKSVVKGVAVNAESLSRVCVAYADRFAAPETKAKADP